MEANNAGTTASPIEIAYKANAQDTRRYPLGRMRDVYLANIANIQPRQIVNIAGTDYQFFPWGQKLTNPGSGVIGSRHSGLMYKLVA